MQTNTASIKNKGGRPQKENPKKDFIGVHCTKEQKDIIEKRAAAINLSSSEFLRELGVNGKIICRTIDKTVLQELGNLSHIRSCLNQLAKKKNQGKDFNLYERTLLFDTADTLLKAGELVQMKIKNELNNDRKTNDR